MRPVHHEWGIVNTAVTPVTFFMQQSAGARGCSWVIMMMVHYEQVICATWPDILSSLLDRVPPAQWAPLRSISCREVEEHKRTDELGGRELQDNEHETSGSAPAHSPSGKCAGAIGLETSIIQVNALHFLQFFIPYTALSYPFSNPSPKEVQYT